MRNFVLQNQKRKRPLNHDRILKATALLYLKEALVREEYEDCAELIQKAKGFGAHPQEIKNLLNSHILGIKTKRVSYAGSNRF